MAIPFISTGSPYLRESALRNLRQYKYSSIDKSYLSKYVLQPYWTFVAKFFPIWMAPNLITLLGFLCVLFNVMLVAIYIPNLFTEAPRWVYFSFAGGIWLYSTLDNVDGKQARRTGTSSPLGEMFDHGCDSLSCVLGALIQAAALRMGTSWNTVSIMFLTMIPFYASTWEHFHTGSLYLGVINGPTEGITIACLLMLMSGILGPQYIWIKLSDLLGDGIHVLPEAMQGYALADFMLLLMFFLLITTQLPVSAYAVYKACASRTTEYSFWETLYQWSPFLLFSMAVYSWVSCPVSLIFKDHPVAFSLLVALIFGHMATSIILSHLVKGKFPMFSMMVMPVVVGSLIVNAIYIVTPYDRPTFSSQVTEKLYFFSALFCTFLLYANFILEIIHHFCAFLKISCLTIPNTAATSTLPSLVPGSESTTFFVNRSAEAISPDDQEDSSAIAEAGVSLHKQS